MSLLNIYNDFYQFNQASIMKHLILWIMIFEVPTDLILGHLISHFKGIFNSKASIKGTAFHLGVLAIVMLLCPLIDIIGFYDIFAQAVIAFTFLPAYASSIITNLKIAGFPVNDNLIKIFQAEYERKKEKYTK